MEMGMDNKEEPR